MKIQMKENIDCRLSLCHRCAKCIGSFLDNSFRYKTAKCSMCKFITNTQYFILKREVETPLEYTENENDEF